MGTTYVCPRLPDGIFSNQKSQFWYILEGLGMENFGIHILWPSDVFYIHFVYFVVIWFISPLFGILYQDKSGNPVFEKRKPNFFEGFALKNKTVM
jgi:hypothetical protein